MDGGLGRGQCLASAQQYQTQPHDPPHRWPSCPRGDCPAELSKPDMSGSDWAAVASSFQAQRYPGPASAQAPLQWSFGTGIISHHFPFLHFQLHPKESSRETPMPFCPACSPLPPFPPHSCPGGRCGQVLRVPHTLAPKHPPKASRAAGCQECLFLGVTDCSQE